MEEVLAAVEAYRDMFIGVLPYVMLQPFLLNNLEHKVVCFNGKALYEANIDNSNKPGGRKQTFPNGITKVDRFRLAEEVIRTLRVKCPFAELSSLVRVDIFYCDYLNKMVVNELESLEAAVYAHCREHDRQMFLADMLSIYHANIIIRDVGKLLNQTLEYIEYIPWPEKWEVLK